MAANDTAALVVALSAQVSKFEKDMKSAVDIADKHTRQIESRFAQMNSAISDKLSQLGASASSNIGLAGTLLRALGPAGVAAAVGIGAAVGGIYALAEAAGRFAERSKALKEGAETAGLTITQFKLLGQAGAKVGLDFEETTAFFTKFISNLEALRQGGGPLFDAILKIDSGLLRQLSTTKDSAQAIDLLVKAYSRLSDQAQRLALARAAGGRAGLTGGRLLDNLAGRGGLSGLEATSPTIDEGQIDRAARLKVEIDEIGKKTANIWGSMFADTILTNQRNARQNIQDLSEWLQKVIQGRITLAALPPIEGGFSVPGVGFVPGNAGASGGLPRGDRTSVPTFDQRFAPAVAQPLRPFTPPPPSGQGSPAAELEILQRQISVLGEGVTQAEQYRLKKLQIAAAAEKDKDVLTVETRALDAFRVAMLAAATATRERLGIATEQQIVESRLAQLEQDRAKFGLSGLEVERARVVILREAKDAADALTVRQSYLPGLKQLEIDALSARKGLDTFATNSLHNLENALVDVVTGTKSASEAFKAMANAILSDLARLAIRQAIIGPLAGGLGGLGGIFGGGSQFAGPAGQTGVVGPLPRFAGGTSSAPGGWSWVGENGPELINLPRGSQVVPNDVARSSGFGAVTISPSTSISIVGSDIKRAEVAALVANAQSQTVSAINRALPARITRMQKFGT